MINSGEPVLVEIGKYIDEQYIPDFLGGTCLSNAGEGGHVPKNLYLPVEQIDPGKEDDILSSTYTTASLWRGAPVEVCLSALSLFRL